MNKIGRGQMLCKVTSKRRAVSDSPRSWPCEVNVDLSRVSSPCGFLWSPLPVAREHGLSHHSGAGYQNGPTSSSFQPTGLELTSPLTIHGLHGAGLDRATPGPMPQAGALRRSAPTVPGLAAELLSAFESTPCFRPTRFEPPRHRSPSPRRPSPTRPIRVPLLNPIFYNSPGPG